MSDSVRRGLAVACATLILILAGCTGGEPEMAPEEARDQLVDVIDQTVALFDEETWEDILSPALGPCSLDNGEGVDYRYAKSGDPDANPRTAVERVAALWTELGIEVRTRLDTARPAVFGVGGPIRTIDFSAAPDSYSVAGTSLCVPGDATEMILDGE